MRLCHHHERANEIVRAKTRGRSSKDCCARTRLLRRRLNQPGGSWNDFMTKAAANITTPEYNEIRATEPQSPVGALTILHCVTTCSEEMARVEVPWAELQRRGVLGQSNWTMP